MKQQKFWTIRIKPMLSLGSFALQDYNEILPGTWWYEFTFLCIEIHWGYVDKSTLQ